MHNGKSVPQEVSKKVFDAMKNVAKCEITMKPEVFKRSCDYMQNLTTSEIDYLNKSKNCHSIMEYVEKELNIVPSKWKRAYDSGNFSAIMKACAEICDSVEHFALSDSSDSDDE